MSSVFHAPSSGLLAAVDFSETADLVLEEAFRIASILRASPHVVHVGAYSGADLYLHTQTGPGVFPAEDANKYLTAFVQKKLDQYQARHGRGEFDVAICHLCAGDPGREIANLAAKLDVDLVVIGTVDRSNVRRLLMGSVAEKVVRLAPCPVFVVREKTREASITQQEASA